ncbi:MAG: hypothetical protein ACRBF0_16500 [Calditrichia bacterium]
MLNTLKATTRIIALAFIVFQLISSSGCSSDTLGSDLQFSVIGNMVWNSTETGTGDPNGEPQGTEMSGENNNRDRNFRDDGTLTTTFDYGPEARYSRDGTWEIADETLILDKGMETESRWNISENGSNFTFTSSISSGGTNFWTRENWTKQ